MLSGQLKLAHWLLFSYAMAGVTKRRRYSRIARAYPYLMGMGVRWFKARHIA